MDGTTDHAKLLADPEFLLLTRTKNRISALLTALTLLIYFGFILLIAFQRDLFAKKAFGQVTVGVLLGIGVIVSSFLLTGIYVRWANGRYDDMVSTVRRKAGHGP